MRATIDRIEGEFAVLEIEGRMVDFPLVLLPSGIGEGSQIEISVSILSAPSMELSPEPLPETPAGTSEGARILERLKAANPDQGPAEIDL